MQKLDFEKILFLDIETVPQYKDFHHMPENLQALWEKKSSQINKDEESIEKIYLKAGIYAEFGKIVCISCGFLKKNEEGKFQLRLKSFFGKDEIQILLDFAELLNKHFYKDTHYLCAHNGKEFDFPYIARRLIINKIPLPKILNSSGMKPWEIRHLDTLELWKFGDFKHYTSLELLTTIFGIENPKDDIKGSEVGSTYWIDNNVERIKEYCQKDVISIVQLFLAYNNMEYIEKDNIILPIE